MRLALCIKRARTELAREVLAKEAGFKAIGKCQLACTIAIDISFWYNT